MEDSIVLYFPQPERRRALAARLAALGYRVRVIDDVAEVASLPAAAVLIAESSAPLHAALMTHPAALPLLVLAGAPPTPQPHYAALPISDEPSDAELRTALAAAAQLLAREQRLQTLLQASPVGVIEIDGSGECVFANAQWIELTGLSRNDCQNRNWTRVIHDEDRDALFADWRAATARCEPLRRELRLRRPNGEVLWVYLQAQPLADGAADCTAAGSVATFTNITPIKQAEARLTETTERFRVALRHSPIVVFNQDRDLRYTWIYNPAGGYEADEVIGKGDDYLFQPEDAARLIAFKQCVMQQRQGDRGEFTVMLEGRPHTYDLVVEPLLSKETGDVIGVTCAAVDISQRKDFELALTASEERFRLLFEHSPLGLALVAPDYRLVDFNPAYCAMLGYTADELRGKTFLEITHPDDRALDLGYAADLLGGKIAHYTLEKRYLHKDGHVIWINLIGTVIRNQQNEVLFGLAIVKDITARREMLDALRKSEAQLTALLDNTPYLMWLKDEDSRFIAVNRSFVQSLGKNSAGEIVGKTDFELWPRERAERYRAEDLTAMAAAGPIFIEAQEIHLGRNCWMEVSKTRVVDNDGKVLGTAGFARDITERREAEHLRIEHLEHQRDVLVREVHHRIKNNLQGVISLIEQLKLKQPLAADALEEAAAQIGTIAVVHGLHSSTLSAEVRPRQLIEAIVDAIARLSATPIDCRPGNDTPGWEWRLNARDTVSIALVINELIYNAIKHAETGARIEVAYGSESGAFAVRIFSQPASLPPGFDFSAGSGLGTGLTLVSSLLPRQGARLTIKPLNNGVEALLRLTHPCASSLPAMQQGQKESMP
jgi:PAS domain S-box-containing protein